VKTLSDVDARRLAARPKRTTIRKLRALRRPRVGRNTPRIGGVETRKYMVRARLVQMRRAGDGEVELVISQPGSRKRTMAVKFPDVACEGALDSQGGDANGPSRAEPRLRFRPRQTATTPARQREDYRSRVLRGAEGKALPVRGTERHRAPPRAALRARALQAQVSPRSSRFLRLSQTGIIYIYT
jgi:hypothetical protein